MADGAAPRRQIGLVAVGAGIGAPVRHWEVVRAVVLGRLPSRGAVTVAARLPAEHAGVIGRLIMARGACRGQRPDVVAMTLRAGQIRMRSRQREVAQVMVECCRFPCRGAVAGTAVRAELPVVAVVFCVAGAARVGCAPEFSVDVARATGDCPVRAREFEGSAIVVEGRRLPRAGSMALRAVRAKLPAMGVIPGMTATARLRRPLEHTVDMAGAASHRSMCPGKSECRSIVIERRRLPGSSSVALRAVRPKSPGMSIIIGMACRTDLWRRRVPAVGMTFRAVNTIVRAGQLKCKRIVIDVNIFPGADFMARSAVRHELATVGVIRLVAGGASLRCAHESSIAMALLAGHIRVPPDKFERELTVIHIDLVPGSGAVAGAAIRLELPVVLIIFLMAAATCHRCALQYAILMTVTARNLCMQACELKLRLRVVEFCWFPASDAVAVPTRCTESPCVRLVFPMAPCAVLWSGS